MYFLVMFLIHFLGFLFKILIVFSIYLVCSLVETGVHNNYPLKHHEFSRQKSKKMNQKHHQKINKFYFIYKSPGLMLVTAENTRNDG